MRPGRLLVALTSVFIVSACSPTGALTPTSVPETPPRTTSISQSPTITETPTPTASPTPSPSVFESFPPPPADETPEQAAIRQGWMNYWRVLDRYLKDSSYADMSEARLVTVPGSEESIAILDQIQGYRDREIVLRGNRLFRDVIVPISDAETDPDAAVITYCHDVREIAAFSSMTGEKLDSPSIGTVVESARLEQGLDGIWRVSVIQNKDAKC